MTDPRLSVVEDRFIYYGDRQVISVLADPDATPEQIAAMRAALAALVRDADTLRQARALARRADEAMGAYDEEAADDANDALYALLLVPDVLDVLATPTSQEQT